MRIYWSVLFCIVSFSLCFAQANFSGKLTYTAGLEGFYILPNGDSITAEGLINRMKRDGSYFNELKIITDGETVQLSARDGKFLLLKDSGFVCVKENMKSRWKTCNDTLMPPWAPKTERNDSIVIQNRDTTILGYLCMHIRVYGTSKTYYDVFLSNNNKFLRRGYHVGGNCTGNLFLIFNATDYFPILAKWNFGGIVYSYSLKKAEPYYTDDWRIERPKLKRLKPIGSF